jgi:hypothetical protein
MSKANTAAIMAGLAAAHVMVRPEPVKAPTATATSRYIMMPTSSSSYLPVSPTPGQDLETATALATDLAMGRVTLTGTGNFFEFHKQRQRGPLRLAGFIERTIKKLPGDILGSFFVSSSFQIES